VTSDIQPQLRTLTTCTAQIWAPRTFFGSQAGGDQKLPCVEALLAIKQNVASGMYGFMAFLLITTTSIWELAVHDREKRR
jgi:hypothetical protein